MSILLERQTIDQLSVLVGGTGEPFVLLHGIPGSAPSWEKVGEALAGRWCVIIPDLLGFGQSRRPQGDYYMADQAEAVKHLLDQLGVTSLYLGGHDFGGPVAITLMRLFPELTIKGLVLSSTNLFVDTYVPPPLRQDECPIERNSPQTCRVLISASKVFGPPAIQRTCRQRASAAMTVRLKWSGAN